MNIFSEIYLELDELISYVGMSNHKIALRKIIDMGKLTSIEKYLKSNDDFCLTRWMS